MRIVNDRARLSHLFGHGPSPFSETQQWAIIAFSGTKRTPTRLFGLSEPIDDPVRPAADGGVEDQPRMVILRVAQQIRLAVEDEARPFEVGAKHGGIDAMKLFDNRTRVAARVRRVIDHTDYPSGLRRRENLGQHGGRIDPWKLVLFALPVEIVIDHVHQHEIEAVARKRYRVRRADEELGIADPRRQRLPPHLRRRIVKIGRLPGDDPSIGPDRTAHDLRIITTAREQVQSAIALFEAGKTQDLAKGRERGGKRWVK